MTRWKGLLFLLIGLLFLSGCTLTGHTTKNHNVAQHKTNLKLKKAESHIKMSAVGDILIHDRVYRDAKTKDGYDFHPMLSAVKPYLQDSTITFANQESIMGGEKIGLSSYPSFNSPTEIGDALQDDGVNVVSMANNHTLDRGEKAIRQSIKNWDKIDMIHTGAFKNEKDRDHIRVVQTKQGISVAFLAYTYGTNGISTPAGKDYLVNRIDKKRMKKDIQKAKKQADVTALSLHFGTEYEHMPNQEQKDLVKFAADEGVDVVLGQHPHVLQPVEWVKGKHDKRTLAIYSLGNFLTGQKDYDTRVGGILSFTIKKNWKKDKTNTKIEKPTFLPTYVRFHGESDYRVVPMSKLTDKQLKHADKRYKKVKKHMSQWLPDLQFVE